MKARLIVAGAGNLIDLLATLYLYHLGYTEANPIMAQLLPYPWLFAAVKLVAMSAVLIWLWRERESRYALIASWVACVTYGAIALYYLYFFTVFI